MNLAALPAHSPTGFHAQLPPGSQHPDLERNKREGLLLLQVQQAQLKGIFLVRLQKHYSHPAKLASISPCTGIASHAPAPTLAGAWQVLPASHDHHSVLQSCFHAASHGKAGGQVRQPGRTAAVREAGRRGERCRDSRCLSRFHTIPCWGSLILSDSICCQFSTALKYQERIGLSRETLPLQSCLIISVCIGQA